MKKDVLTKYLAIFLVICIVLDIVMVLLFSNKTWWNNWMAMVPIIFMILGAFYCNLMKANIDARPDNMTWLFVYKGIKIAVTVLFVVLYVVFAGQSKKIFIGEALLCYLIALATETWAYTDYQKRKNKESGKA